MNKVDLSILIVTWNSANYITNCLRSFYESLEGINNEVIVVDNNSQDDTCKIILKNYPKVRLFQEKQNWGFGKGSQIGIEKSLGEFILIINPDTKVNKLAVNSLLNFLKTHDGVGAVGPEQLNGAGRTRFNLSRLSLRGTYEFLIEKSYSLIKGKNRILFTQPREVKILDLACCMFRRKIAKEGALFDPKLFLYGEEHQFFYKIRSLGWKIYFLRNCYIYHYKEGSIAPTHKKPLVHLKSFLYRFMKVTKRQ